MNLIEPNSLADYLTTLDPWRTLALIAAVLAAQAVLYLVLGRVTRRARARAREAARAWAEEQRGIWRARATARAQRAAAAETDSARAERAARRGAVARAALVAVIAVAATNLSVHGIQGGLADVGLGALDTRISVFVVFEGMLALTAGLSWWHQTSNQAGYDRYRLAMWAITAVMAYLGWAWSGSLVFALWAPLAAVAWHWVTTAEARRRHGGLGVLARLRAAASARIRRRFLPAGEADRARRILAIERRAWRANTTRWARAIWERAHVRALDAADARGYLDDATRLVIAERVAARYAGARALSPEAVAHLNPWARLAAPGGETPDAPAPDAPRVERAPVPVPVPDAEDGDDVRARIDAALTGPADADTRIKVVDWLADYWHAHHAWPTGRALAEAFAVHQATGRKWLTSVKDAA